MEYERIPKGVTQPLLHKKHDVLYVVDPKNEALKSLNGNVYSKDGEELYLISELYTTVPFIMPDTVKTMKRGACPEDVINFAHISTELNCIEENAIVPQQTMDLRNTKCTAIPLAYGQAADYFRFPFGSVFDVYGRTMTSKPNCLLANADTRIVALFDIDGEDYTVPDNVKEVIPQNQYIDLAHKKKMHFNRFILSKETNSIASVLLNRDVVEQFVVPPDNESFFIFEGCLYRRISTTGTDYSLAHIPRTCTKLHILEGTTCIEEYAAANMTFEEIVFPKTIKKIQNSAFRNCTFLSDVHVYAEKLETNAFCVTKGSKIYLHSVRDCYSCCFENSVFELVDLSDTEINCLDDRFFMGAEIGQVVLPTTLKTINIAVFKQAVIHNLDARNTALQLIGNQAFLGCQISEIALPDTVVIIGTLAFSQTQLKTFDLITTGGVFVDKMAFEDNAKLTRANIPNAKNVSTKAFYNCPCLTDVVLAEDADISASAFYKTKIKKKTKTK